jgi:two-component system response regulator (stage 0 sporulation protein A)
MGKLLTVLLVEDDLDECKEFDRLIDSTDDIRLIGTTDSAEKALDYVKDHLPDAIILDLELHKGSGNGISFLQALDETHMRFPPYILVTTHNISRITHERVRQLGADFITVKSQEDYCAGTAVEFLQSLKSTIHKQHSKVREHEKYADTSPCETRKRQEIRVTAEIDKIGISPKALGRAYLIDAIMLKLYGKSTQVAEVAQKYGKTNSSVERAMQNAINKAWSTMHPDDLFSHYTSQIHSDKGVPTVTEFVCHYANRIKTEY